MNLLNKKPDFENLKNILLHKEKKFVPVFEALVADEIKEKILGRKINSIKDEIDFWINMGYDFIPMPAGILKLGQNIEEANAERKEKPGAGEQKARSPEREISNKDREELELQNQNKWACEHDGLITGKKDFENYNWPRPDLIDYTNFNEAARYLPDNMKIIGVGGKIFTATWMLMGFNNFCLKLYEEPGLVKKVFEKVSRIQFEVFENVIELSGIGGYLVSDDIAYSEGLIISSKILRDYVFPQYEMIGKICRKKEIPFIYHSDGNIMEVMDDIINCGFTALHPIEPKAMNIEELCIKFGDKICFVGNIELDDLIRSSTDTIKKLVLSNLKKIAEKYYYVVGSSNSIPEKVPVENYLNMIKTTFEAQNLL